MLTTLFRDTVRLGESWGQLLRFQQADGTPIDFTGIAPRFKLLKPNGTLQAEGTASLTLSSVDPDTYGGNGEVLVGIPVAVSAALTPGVTYEAITTLPFPSGEVWKPAGLIKALHG
jgi:hypothetical protein